MEAGSGGGSEASTPAAHSTSASGGGPAAPGGQYSQLAELFDQQASLYKAYRPRYPRHVFEAIYGFAGLSGCPEARTLAVDVGCGSGQVPQGLAADFQRVLALDNSPRQLAWAVDLPNVEYRQAVAESTGLLPHSADLVTAAAALHSFDVRAFFREARRILKPGVTLAAWCYVPGREQFQPLNPEADAVLHGLRQRLFSYFHPRMQRFLRQQYSEDVPSSADFGVVRQIELSMELDMTVAQAILGWVRSWSAYTSFTQQHGNQAGEAVLHRAQHDLLHALGVGTAEAPLKVVWPIDMVLARDPLPLY